MAMGDQQEASQARDRGIHHQPAKKPARNGFRRIPNQTKISFEWYPEWLPEKWASQKLDLTR